MTKTQFRRAMHHSGVEELYYLQLLRDMGLLYIHDKKRIIKGILISWNIWHEKSRP